VLHFDDFAACNSSIMRLQICDFLAGALPAAVRSPSHRGAGASEKRRKIVIEVSSGSD
jgi:hypothetical protein